MFFGDIFYNIAYLAFEVIADTSQHREVDSGDFVVAVGVELSRTEITVFDDLILAYPSAYAIFVEGQNNFSHNYTAFRV